MQLQITRPTIMKCHEAILVCIALTFTPLQAEDFLTVSTPSGDVTGIGVDVTGLQGAKTYQFRQIPFAKPPFGELRFAKPKPYGKWDETLDGTEFGPSCIQPMNPFFDPYLPNVNTSEDCLFLNICLPHGLDKTKNKTVMVWIHGGGYYTGQGMLYDASYMAAKADVIMVTINYRLNMFGFGSLGKGVLKGNYGIWDQILALQWVNDNINAFGGDPNSVTIFGESAGGFSVALLALIPSNKGLFHRVIAESGVSNSLFTMQNYTIHVTKTVGQTLGCDSSDANSFLPCLRTKSADEILKATNDCLTEWGHTDIHLWVRVTPVVDHELFNDTPENLMRNESTEASIFFRSLDFIVGNVNAEGSLIINITTQRIQERFKFNITEGIQYNVFCGEVVHTLVSDYYNNNSNVSEAICKQYGVKNNIEKQASRLVQMFTDLIFLSPSVSTLRYHANPNTVKQKKQFQYVFTKVNVPFILANIARPSWLWGASHTSELIYLFGLRDLVKRNLTVTSEDLILSDKMVTYWTNFAKTGNPNGAGTVSAETTWPEFEPGAEAYLILDDTISTGTSYMADGVKFWLNDIPSLLNSSVTRSVATNGNPAVAIASTLVTKIMFVLMTTVQFI